MKGISVSDSAMIRPFWGCLLLALLALAGWSASDDGISIATAQEEAAAEAAPEAPANGGDAEAAELERRKQESFLAWMIRASGIFGFLIMLCSFVLVALIMMDFLQLRRSNYLPADFVEQFEQKVNARDLPGAFELAKNNDSFIARVLTAGMGRLNRSWEEAEQGMQEVGEDETMAMEHKVGYLALIGSVAPMLGLLGTVQGMVLSFQVIATSATSPKPYQLADGIATALFTTLEGLTVAIPAIVFFSIFKNRLARYVMECGFVAENLMNPIQKMMKAQPSRPAGGGAPSAAPAAPQA